MAHPGRSSSGLFLSSWWPSELNGRGKVRLKQCSKNKLWWVVTSNPFSKEETERTRSKNGGPGRGYNYWRRMKCQYANTQFLVSMFSDTVFNSQRLKATVHMFRERENYPIVPISSSLAVASAEDECVSRTNRGFLSAENGVRTYKHKRVESTSPFLVVVVGSTL